jgi:hypothetical protein
MPPVAQRRTIVSAVAAPAFEARSVRLADGGVEWAIAKPMDLSSSHGVDVTLERLEEMAAAYDPVGIEAAAVNFDHLYEGPAQGWIQSIAVRAGHLWAKPIELSAELIEAVAAGRYRRVSMEFHIDHPVTRGWYFHGLAVLGSMRPAIKGLPPISLSERPAYVFLDPPAAERLTSPPPSPDRGHQAPAGAAAGLAAVPAGLPSGRPGEVLLAAMEAAASRLVAGGTSDQRVIALAAAAEREGTIVRETIAALRSLFGGRASPLLAAAEAGDPRTQEERATHQRMGLSDEGALQLLVGRQALGVRFGATPWWVDPESWRAESRRGLDDRTAAERATHRRMGLSDERALELRAQRGVSAPRAAPEPAPRTLADDGRSWEEREAHQRMGLSDARYLELAERRGDISGPAAGVMPWWRDPRAEVSLHQTDERTAEERATHRRMDLSDEEALQLMARVRLREQRTTTAPALAPRTLADDGRSWEDRETHRRMGLSDERYLELAERRGDVRGPAPGVLPWWADSRAAAEINLV